MWMPYLKTYERGKAHWEKGLYGRKSKRAPNPRLHPTGILLGFIPADEPHVRHEKNIIKDHNMTPKQFYDWQTAGGTDDVMRLVDCLERADLAWCAIGGVAVNHWAAEAMVTQDVDFVVAAESVDLATKILEEAGFKSERFPWSVNFRGRSKVRIQLSTEDFYKDFPSRSVPADIHGILMRVASLEDTLSGKIKAWRDAEGRQSKKLKDLGDIARLIESHPHLWEMLDPDLKEILQKQ
jgi:hypothetical protein